MKLARRPWRVRSKEKDRFLTRATITITETLNQVP